MLNRCIIYKPIGFFSVTPTISKGSQPVSNYKQISLCKYLQSSYNFGSVRLTASLQWHILRKQYVPEVAVRLIKQLVSVSSGFKVVLQAPDE